MKKLFLITIIIIFVQLNSFAQMSYHNSNYKHMQLANNDLSHWRLNNYLQSNEKPPLHFDAIAVEIAGGTLSGLLLGGFFLTISNPALTAALSYFGFPDDIPLKEDLKFFYPLYTGMIVGSSLLVNYIGDRRDDNGSFWSALSGSAISFLVSFRINNTLRFIGPAIGATIAYNLTRNPVSKTSSSGGSLVNIKNNAFNLSIPQISFKYDNSIGGSGLIQSVSLMRISF